MVSNKQLREVRDWAQAMTYSQREPRWTWQRYKDLVALIDGILASQSATFVLEDAKRADAAAQYARPRQENVISLDRARRRAVGLSARLAV